MCSVFPYGITEHVGNALNGTYLGFSFGMGHGPRSCAPDIHGLRYFGMFLHFTMRSGV